MKAIQLVGRGQIEIGEVPDVHPGPGEVAVASDFVGLCGTDLHVVLGQFEERVPYPAVLGHEFGGKIAELGEGVDTFDVGDAVVVDPVFPCGECPLCQAGRHNVCVDVDVLGIDCAGAMAERVVVDSVNVLALPPSVPASNAPMAELYTVAVHSSRITRIETGDVVVILGAGRLGLSLLDVMRQGPAAQIIAVDVLDSRLEVAKSLGADLVLNANDVDPVAEVMARTGDLGVDKVVEAVGHAVELPGRKPPMYTACQMIRPGGQITAMGQGGHEELFFWKPFVLKEAAIVSSRLNLGDMPRAVRMMADGLLHPDEIITHVIRPDEVQRGFEMMEQDPGTVIKVVVDMSTLGE
ncbi:MAG: alcohol dehydrogenase catalytic domain-containing protein [Planctomycetota bacterium]